MATRESKGKKKDWCLRSHAQCWSQGSFVIKEFLCGFEEKMQENIKEKKGHWPKFDRNDDDLHVGLWEWERVKISN